MADADWTPWLVESGLVSAGQLEDAVRLAGLRSLSLPDAVIALGYAEPPDLARVFAVQNDCPLIDFYGTRIPEEVIRAVPDVLVRELELVPVSVDGGVLWYATPHVADASRRDRLCGILNREARPLWATREWVRMAELEYYAVCQVTEAGSGWWFAKYSDDQWLLLPGNRFRGVADRPNRSHGHPT